MNEQMDGRTDEWMDKWTDERKSPCILQDFVPFGAAAQKEQVAQGQFVVSDTRCPALRDCGLRGSRAVTLT